MNVLVVITQIVFALIVDVIAGNYPRLELEY
jgi:hypothetical protein